MIKFSTIRKYISGHRVIIMMALCLFGFCLQVLQVPAARKRRARTTVVKKNRSVRKPTDERVHLLHSDELFYDMYGKNPDAQILKGKVHFTHSGANLTCDSAYFYQASNSFKAFGHVHFRQGDTLSMTCDRAEYDGMMQMMRARQNVVLTHRKQVLRTDSLDYDRLYQVANYFEGGTLVDGKDKLVSDWGEYYLDTKQAKFVYNVKLRSGKDLVTTDTLYYDVNSKKAHMVGPSKMVSASNGVVNTSDGYYDTNTRRAQLYGRSTIVDKEKTVTGDSLYYIKDGDSEGFGHVVYVDKKNKNSLTCDYLKYNEKTGYGFATKNPVAVDFSKPDTLWVHSDTMKIYTFNIQTDSVYRKVHAFPHVRAFRNDVQAICDSLVFNSKDSCMTMYRDPIVWNQGKQLLGEEIRVYTNDSTVRFAHVIGQALSVEQMPDSVHFNQITSKEMMAYFTGGEMTMAESVGNVLSVYYMTNDKDSSLVGLNNMETDTLRMFMGPNRKLQKIWTNKATGTFYPITQVPPSKAKLANYAWFEELRPVDKNDIYVWRGKKEGTALKEIKRHEAPIQKINSQQKEEPVETPKPAEAEAKPAEEQ